MRIRRIGAVALTAGGLRDRAERRPNPGRLRPNPGAPSPIRGSIQAAQTGSLSAAWHAPRHRAQPRTWPEEQCGRPLHQREVSVAEAGHPSQHDYGQLTSMYGHETDTGQLLSCPRPLDAEP